MQVDRAFKFYVLCFGAFQFKLRRVRIVRFGALA